MVYTATTHLTSEHQQHLLDEGFSLERIEELEKNGFRSVTEEEARNMGFQVKTKDGYKSGSGLYIPFNTDFGQLRLDTPIEREKGSKAKYLTPIGAKSQALIPGDGKVITEGAKDAYAGNMHGGIPTGAIAGISHYRKALKQGAGYTVLFDADGWTNPSVLSNLFHAGKWLNGRVQLLPEIPGQPKAGLCEYFKWLEYIAEEQGIKDIAAFKKQEYQKLIAAAMTPEELLFEWVGRFKAIPPRRLSQALTVAFNLAATHLKKPDQNRLVSILAKKTQYSKKDLEQGFLWKAVGKRKRIQERKAKRHIKEQASQQRKEDDKRRFNEAWAKMERALEIAEQEIPPSEEELDEIWEYLESRPDSFEKKIAQQGILAKWKHILLPESRYKQASKAIKKLYGGRLRFNTLKQQLEFSDEPLDLDFARHEICSALDKDIPQSDLTDILLGLANQRRYCPVAEYLERVAEVHADDDLDLDTLIDILVTLKDSTEQNKRLARAYFKRHLIASVARPFNPGCKVDTALILQGNQGLLKSMFLATLYRQDLGWFDDTMSESGDKDELLKLHLHWCVEWAEFEQVLGRKANSKVKSFMTTKVDNVRPPYGRMTKAFPRRGVLVGSTNQDEFLSDTSGDRRFWIIAVTGFNIELLKQLRDRIWAAAVKAYRSGEQWWLTREEEALHDEANKPFRMSDPWELPIEQYIQKCHCDTVTTSELLTSAIELEVARQTRGDEMRVTGILKRMGWSKSDKRVMLNGVKRWVWLAPSQPTNPPSQLTAQPDQPFIEVRQEVGQASNNATVAVSSVSDQPAQPFSPTFSETETKNTEGGGEAKVFCHSSEKSLEKGWADSEVGQASNSEIVTVTSLAQPLTTTLETDYSTFPHLTCDTIEAKRNQANEIKRRLLEARNKESLTTVREDYSSRCNWVWINLLSKAEKEKLRAIATTEQLSLLDAKLSPASVAKNELQDTESVTDEQVPQQHELSTYQTAEVQAEETDWLSEESIQDILECLQFCKDLTTLDNLRQAWTSDEAKKAMNIACKRLSPEKHSQIKQWVLESKKVNPQ